MAGVSSRTRSRNVPLFSSISVDGSFSSKSKRRKSDEDDKGLDSVSGFSTKNVLLFGVSSRTRSKNVPLFGSLSVDGSSKRRKSDGGEKGLDSVSGSKKMKVEEEEEEPFVVPKNAKVVSIDEDEKMFDSKDGNFVEKKCGLDEDNPISICSDEYGESDEEHSVSFDADNEEQQQQQQQKEGDDVKEEVKNDESKGSGEFDVKDKKFVDEKCGLAQENTVITIDTDEDGESDEEENHSVGSDSDNAADDDDANEGANSDESGGIGEFADEDSDESDDDDDDDSDETEEDDDSSGDFKVEELDEISDNDDDDSSSDSYVDEKEDKKKGYRKDLNVVEKLVREVMDRKYGISEKNNANSPSSTSTDELEHADRTSVSSSVYVKKGSSKLNGVSETLKARSVDVKVKNVSDENVNVGVNAKSKDNVGDSDEGKDQYVGGVSSVRTKQGQKKESDKQKMMENKGRDYKVGANIRNGAKKGEENEVLWEELDAALRESKAVSKVNLLFKHIEIELCI